MKNSIHQAIVAAIEKLQSNGVWPSFEIPEFDIVYPPEEKFGDFACSLPLSLASKLKKSPMQIAEEIKAHFVSEDVDRIEIAAPGHMNFFVQHSALQNIVREVNERGSDFGSLILGEGKKVMVEFVSANPTGPLHVGHGRGATIGDCLSSVLQKAGWDVTREFYYNDAGVQIDNLTLSVQLRCKGVSPEDPSWPESGYRGEYIADVAKAYMNKETVVASDKQTVGKGDVEDAQAVREFAVAYLRREQDLDLKAFRVAFDTFYLESSLYSDGKVAEVVKMLIDGGYTYERDGALWLRTTEFGDDKDRVMRKSDGSYTYFVPDVAYHVEKWRRGFQRVINEQGSDHHNTINRVRAGLQALKSGIPEGWPDYILHQMVTVLKDGIEVKISKRAGSYVTLRDLIDEVGKDAVRFIFTSYASSSHINFDINTALEHSEKNPVYYVQYAHARLCSVLEKAKENNLAPSVDMLELLTHEKELSLMREMAKFPELIERIAASYETHLLPRYAIDLADKLHSFYNECRVIDMENRESSQARLALISSVKIVLAETLRLIGISAPSKM